MAKRQSEPVEARCPVYRVLERLCGEGERSEFVDHLRNARVEMLLAVRSLIDRRIEELKAKPAKKSAGKSRSKRIEVKGE
ncbi:MAG: hypothetical protein ACLF0G_16575 [Candidatus Brocadiia bacterium]